MYTIDPGTPVAGNLNFSGTTSIADLSPATRTETVPTSTHTQLYDAVVSASDTILANTVTRPERLTVNERPSLPPTPEGAPLIAVPMPTHTESFALYHVDVGVDYWYFERCMMHAIRSHFIQVHGEGLHDDDLGDVTISRLRQTRAEALNFVGEDGEIECNMYEAGLRYGPGFIGCSEY